jgi:uncharacterized membrane protein
VTVILIAAMAAAAVLFMARTARPSTSAGTIARSGVPTLDHAERILANRYARGQITVDEYGRMLAVLRR